MQNKISTKLKETVKFPAKDDIKSYILPIIGLWFIILITTGYYNGYHIPMTLVIILGLMGTLLIVFNRMAIENIAFLIILFMGSFYAFTMPILDNPDEEAHLGRAFYLSEGHFGMSGNIEDLKISEDFYTIQADQGKNVYETTLRDEKHSSKKKVYEFISATNTNSFISYLPQAVGLLIGSLLHLSLFWTFFLGRFLNLVVYTLLAKKAIRMAKGWKIPLTFITCMPMTLFLAGSYNPDAISFGVVFVTISYLVSLITSDKLITIKQIGIYTLLCCLLATIKLPYVALIALLLFISPKKYAVKKTYLVIVSTIILTGIITLLWLSSYLGIKPAHRSILVDPVKQLKLLFTDVNHAWKIFVSSIFYNINRYMQLFRFGWLTYGSEELSYLHLFVYGAVAMFYPLGIKLKKLNRWGLVLVSIVISVLIDLSQYLTWTPVGLEYIEGVQGRYFIGVLVLLMLAFNKSRESYKLDTTSSEMMEVNPALERKMLTIILYFVVAMACVQIAQYY